MKILQLTKKLPIPPKDGESVAILQLTNGFVKAGHEVIMLCMNTNKHPQKIPENINFKLLTVNINTNINPLNLFFSDFLSTEPYLTKRFLSKNYTKSIKKLIEKEKPDIIQAEGLFAAQYFRFLQDYKIPKIFRSHNIEARIWERRSRQDNNLFRRTYSKLIFLKLSKYEQKIAHLSDGIVSISKDDYTYFQALNNSIPSITIPTSYPFPPDPLSFSQTPNIVFLASLDWYPNTNGLNWFLQKAWPQIIKQIPEIKLHIAGRNPDKNLASYLQKFKNVHFHGEINNVKDYLIKGRILIVPLFIGSGMRIKIIEAMSLGIPVVATSIAAEGIPISHSENILLADKPAQFAQHCIRLMNDELLEQKIAKNARVFIRENYQPEKLTNKLINFYVSNYLPE